MGKKRKLSLQKGNDIYIYIYVCIYLSFVVFQKLQSHPTVMLFALIALEKFAQTSRYSDFLD